LHCILSDWYFFFIVVHPVGLARRKYPKSQKGNRQPLNFRSHIFYNTLLNNPTAYAVLAGFTFNIGSEEINTDLSYRRAQRVADYLKDNFNIGQERIVMSWYRLSWPMMPALRCLG